MERLTHQRNNGIKSGYWSPAKKEELVQRLAEYENAGLDPEEILEGRLLTGWIAVEEKLPENGQYVLVCFDYGTEDDPQVEVLEFKGEIGGFGWDGDQTIVAWMSLPEPYQV